MIDLLLDASVPVVIQGATGRAGRQHTLLMRAYGTNVVAGVTTRLDGPLDIEGIPIFATVAQAVRSTGARASVVMVPPFDVRGAIFEAIDAGVQLIVSVTEGVPVHDALACRARARQAGVTWIGASTPGIAIPGRMKLGFLPDIALAPGPLAVLSKSGTLSYETCYRLVRNGLGQTAWIGVGGDPVKGTRFGELIPLLARHEPTRGVVVIGELGGNEEEDLALALRATRFVKPVYALIAGAVAPEGVTMGHAGALVQGGRGSIADKRAALEAAGARVFNRIDALVAAAVAGCATDAIPRFD